MDPFSYEKPRLWLNVVCMAIFLWMVAYPFRTGNTVHLSSGAALLFLLLAINCAFRIYSYLKLIRIRKRAASVAEIVRAERRQSLIISIFSNATAILGLLYFFVQALAAHSNLVYAVVLAVCILCFAGILILSIRNLRRFDEK